MTKTPRDPNGNGTREARLKAALRANLARRKAQVRGRAEQAEQQIEQGDPDTGEASGSEE